MIRESKVLSYKDWELLNGNELFICMLKNKVKVEPKDKATSEHLIDDIIEYLDKTVENLVYYDIENVYGYRRMEIFFEGVIDKENFISFYNTSAGLYHIKK
jgi:hypothetical protein